MTIQAPDRPGDGDDAAIPRGRQCGGIRNRRASRRVHAQCGNEARAWQHLPVRGIMRLPFPADAAMLKFYYSLAPNPMKVALFLEEAGLPYEPIPVDTRKGEQHAPAFRAINPNGKVPVIVDGEVTVFDSGAILLYLGEKTGKFMPPATPQARGPLLSWMMFIASGRRPVLRPGRALRAVRAREGPVRAEALPVRGAAPSRHPRPAARRPPLHAGRRLHGRRHGDVGLGAPRAVRPQRGEPVGRASRTSSASSTRSRRARPRSARWRSRSGTRSRRRWTTRRDARCSRTSRRRQVA